MLPRDQTLDQIDERCREKLRERERERVYLPQKSMVRYPLYLQFINRSGFSIGYAFDPKGVDSIY